MKTIRTLLALGLSALLSVPALAVEDSVAGAGYGEANGTGNFTVNTYVDSASAIHIEQDPIAPAVVPSIEAASPEATAVGGSDGVGGSEMHGSTTDKEQSPTDPAGTPSDEAASPEAATIGGRGDGMGGGEMQTAASH